MRSRVPATVGGALVAGLLLSVATPMPSASAAGDHLEPVKGEVLQTNALGGDGRMWSRDGTGLRRLGANGGTTSYPIAGAARPHMSSVVAASDGSIWATVDDNHEVWRIDPNAPVPTPELVNDFGTAEVRSLTAAGGGRVWAWQGQVVAGQNRLAVMDEAGLLESFDVADVDEPDHLGALAGAPDGALWFSGEPVTDGSPADNTTATRVGLDGAVSQVALETDDPNVTSLAFDAHGTLWYTTYNRGYVTISGDTGGGIGRYAPGVSDWSQRPVPRECVDPAVTYECGATPERIQPGPRGRMYFTEPGNGFGVHLARVNKRGVVQFVNLGGFRPLDLHGDKVWLDGFAGGQLRYARGDLDELFDVSVEKVRVSLRWRAGTREFTGRLRSANSGCETTKVRLYRVVRGERVLVRTRRAEQDGTFRFKIRATPGRYLAKVKRVELPGDITTCAGAASPTRTVLRLP